MSVVKTGVFQSLSKLSAIGQSAIIQARSPVPEPQHSSARPLITLEQRLEFLDEGIHDLTNLIAELIAEDADENEQLEYAAELRIFRDARDEIVYLRRGVLRLRITGPQPRDYEEWIPWAYEQMRPRTPQGTPEPEYDCSDWLRWAKSKTTVVRVVRAQSAGQASPVATPPSKPPRKSPRRFWSLKIALRRFWVAISVTRSR